MSTFYNLDDFYRKPDSNEKYLFHSSLFVTGYSLYCCWIYTEVFTHPDEHQLRSTIDKYLKNVKRLWEHNIAVVRVNSDSKLLATAVYFHNLIDGSIRNPYQCGNSLKSVTIQRPTEMMIVDAATGKNEEVSHRISTGVQKFLSSPNEIREFSNQKTIIDLFHSLGPLTVEMSEQGIKDLEVQIPERNYRWPN